jgi:hypothetical protein
MEDELKTEKQQTGKKSLGDYQTFKSKMPVTSKGKVVVEQLAKPHNMDVFGSLTAERKLVKDRIKKKQEEEKTTGVQKANSKAGKLQANQTNIQNQAVPYSSRNNRGQVRFTYNEGVAKIPGVFNEGCRVEVKIKTEVNQYDFLNLNSIARTSAMQSHFNILEACLKKQLNQEAFEDFFSPVQTCQRVCGRVINISTEEQKMKEQAIGLFNANYEPDCRLRLNMNEVPSFSLLEGEVIVAEGFMDTKKFNVNRIWKP